MSEHAGVEVPRIELVGDILVHMDRGVYMWCQLTSFTVATPNASDRDVVTAVLAHPRYHDHCAGPIKSQSKHDLHGPYRIETITTDSFAPIATTQAVTLLHEWLREAISSEYQDSIIESQRLVDLHVAPLLTGADRIYQLVLPREGNEHDWGWVVGANGFHEFITINREQSTATMIIATDD